MSGQTIPSIRSILLADDSSEHAQAAIQLLCSLALPAETTILAVSVFTPLQTSDHERLRKSLENAQACLYNRGMTVSTELVLGYPAEKIIELAGQADPDLIVLGARGLRATLGILLGGVAQQVVEYANWPVLVVRAPFTPIRKVLLAVDGSACSRHAMQYLASFPLPEDCSLEVMHVLPPPPHPESIVATWPPVPELIQPDYAISEQEIATIMADEEARGKELLEQAVQVLQQGGHTPATLLKRGDAATEIMDIVRSHRIDLIVVGSRGLSPVKGWLLGSVSRKLIHYSGCSILVVKKKT
jgi:nucleotide-binding universal stress UspA family protein